MKVKQSMQKSIFTKQENIKRVTANTLFLPSLLGVSQESFQAWGSNQTRPKGKTTACSYCGHSQSFIAGKAAARHLPLCVFCFCMNQVRLQVNWYHFTIWILFFQGFYKPLCRYVRFQLGNLKLLVVIIISCCTSSCAKLCSGVFCPHFNTFTFNVLFYLILFTWTMMIPSRTDAEQVITYRMLKTGPVAAALWYQAAQVTKMRQIL